jgi:hypothetical protein
MKIAVLIRLLDLGGYSEPKDLPIKIDKTILL